MPTKRRTKNKAADTTPLYEPAAKENSKPEIHHHYYAKNPHRFDFGKLSLGLFLIVLGILYLGKNMGWINLDFNFNLWQLWPLLIIFAGLSLLTGRTVASIFAGIILTLTVITIAFVMILGQTSYQPASKTGPGCFGNIRIPATVPSAVGPTSTPQGN
jgi:hypothetical protein